MLNFCYQKFLKEVNFLINLFKRLNFYQDVHFTEFLIIKKGQI